MVGPSDEVGSLRDYVSVTKRQLGRRDPEWFTLWTLRNLVVTTIFGRSGFEWTSRAVSSDDLPEGCTEDDLHEVVEIGKTLMEEFSDEFEDRLNTVISTPAVMAAIGAVAHRSMPWAEHPRQVEQLVDLLREVNWKRDPITWNGLCAKITPTGNLSFAGGVKDSGSKTATAIDDPSAFMGCTTPIAMTSFSVCLIPPKNCSGTSGSWGRPRRMHAAAG